MTEWPKAVIANKPLQVLFELFSDEAKQKF